MTQGKTRRDLLIAFASQSASSFSASPCSP